MKRNENVDVIAKVLSEIFGSPVIVHNVDVDNIRNNCDSYCKCECPCYDNYDENDEYEECENPRLTDIIDRIIAKDRATVIFWKDGTKTVVKCNGENFDYEKGIAMATLKYIFGNSYYSKDITKLIEKFPYEVSNNTKNESTNKSVAKKTTTTKKTTSNKSTTKKAVSNKSTTKKAANEETSTI